MKKILLVITLSLSCALFGETTVEIVKIDVPYEWDYNQGLHPLTFSDGSTQIFRNIKFTLVSKDLDVAISEYNKAHMDLVTDLNSTDPESGERYFTTGQAANNLSIWETTVANAIAKGESKQLMKNVDAIKSLSQTTEEAAKEVQDVYKQTVTKIGEIRTGVETMVSSIRSESDSAISSLQSQLAAATQAQSKKMQQLAAAMADGSTATAAQQAHLKAEVEKASVAVASIQKAIKTLNRSATIVVPVEVDGYLHYSVYTNDMNRLSTWLCATNKIGTFSAARHPFYPESVANNMNDYNDSLGLIQYLSKKKMDYYESHSREINSLYAKFGHAFFEVTDLNTKTNVYSNFKAPKNWADGTSIVCTDGVYRVSEPFTTNTWNKLRRSLTALTNELFKAGGLTNAFANATNSLANVTNTIYDANHGITNMPTVAINMNNMLDNASIWTNGERRIEVKGFEKADAYTVPMVVEDSDDNAIEWSKKDFSDSEIVKKIGQYAQYNRSIGIADTNEFIQAYGRRIYEIYGFDDAEENTVPVKCKTIGNNMEIEWKPYGGSALKFIGNYDETAVVVGNGGTTNTVTFAALDEGENPSVKVKVEADGANGVILKLGAFYK